MDVEFASLLAEQRVQFEALREEWADLRSMVSNCCFHKIGGLVVDSALDRIWDFESPIWDSESEDSTFESNDDDLPIWDAEFEDSDDEEVLAIHKSDLIVGDRLEDLDFSVNNFLKISSEDVVESTSLQPSHPLQMFDHMLQRNRFSFLPLLEETFDGNSKRIRDPGIEETLGKNALFEVVVCSFVYSLGYGHDALPQQKYVSDDKHGSSSVEYYDTGWKYFSLEKGAVQHLQVLQYANNAYELRAIYCDPRSNWCSSPSYQNGQVSESFTVNSSSGPLCNGINRVAAVQGENVFVAMQCLGASHNTQVVLLNFLRVIHSAAKVYFVVNRNPKALHQIFYASDCTVGYASLCYASQCSIDINNGCAELQLQCSYTVEGLVYCLQDLHDGSGELGPISSENSYRLCILADSLCEIQESKLSMCTVSSNPRVLHASVSSPPFVVMLYFPILYCSNSVSMVFVSSAFVHLKSVKFLRVGKVGIHFFECHISVWVLEFLIDMVVDRFNFLRVTENSVCSVLRYATGLYVLTFQGFGIYLSWSLNSGCRVLDVIIMKKHSGFWKTQGLVGDHFLLGRGVVCTLITKALVLAADCVLVVCFDLLFQNFQVFILVSWCNSTLVLMLENFQDSVRVPVSFYDVEWIRYGMFISGAFVDCSLLSRFFATKIDKWTDTLTDQKIAWTATTVLWRHCYCLVFVGNGGQVQLYHTQSSECMISALTHKKTLLAGYATAVLTTSHGWVNYMYYLWHVLSIMLISAVHKLEYRMTVTIVLYLFLGSECCLLANVSVFSLFLLDRAASCGAPVYMQSSVFTWVLDKSVVLLHCIKATSILLFKFTDYWRGATITVTRTVHDIFSMRISSKQGLGLLARCFKKIVRLPCISTSVVMGYIMYLNPAPLLTMLETHVFHPGINSQPILCDGVQHTKRYGDTRNCISSRCMEYSSSKYAPYQVSIIVGSQMLEWCGMMLAGSGTPVNLKWFMAWSLTNYTTSVASPYMAINDGFQIFSFPTSKYSGNGAVQISLAYIAAAYISLPQLLSSVLSEEYIVGIVLPTKWTSSSFLQSEPSHYILIVSIISEHQLTESSTVFLIVLSFKFVYHDNILDTMSYTRDSGVLNHMDIGPCFLQRADNVHFYLRLHKSANALIACYAGMVVWDGYVYSGETSANMASRFTVLDLEDKVSLKEEGLSG